MRGTSLLLLSTLALAGCTCSPTGVSTQRFACTTTAECADGFACRGGECHPTSGPGGECNAGDTKPCAIAGCQQLCGDDGGFAQCAPTTGGGFAQNANHCGECGRQCNSSGGFTCVDSHCSCTLDTDCPTGDVCAQGGLCVNNSDPCGSVRCPLGKVCRSGACTVESCDGGCGLAEVCSTGQCRPVDPCRFAVACDPGGVCEGGPKPDGIACDDAVACSRTDVCVAGSCAGTPYGCPAPNQCQLQLTCTGDGGCAVTNQPDGTPCDDTNACTFGDSCVAGACTGTTYSCTPSACSASSVCAGDGGCLVTPRNVGDPCDDGNACSFADSCSDAGVCGGSIYTCPAPATCEQTVACAGDGGCVVTNKADGATCNDGVACTTNDVCTNGVCAGTPGTTYQDVDGDGVGNSAVTSTVCPPPAGYVAVGGDCNDNNAATFQMMMVVADVDQDGVTKTTALSAQCVGATSLIGGRTYYKDSTGAFTWLAVASAAADCDDANVNVFQTLSVAADADHDGLTKTTTLAAQCVGATSVINTRTYYKDSTGAFTWLTAASASVDCDDTSAAIGGGTDWYTDADADTFGTGVATNACTAPVGKTATNNTDCNDANAFVNTNRLVFTDADQDGYTDNAAITECTGASSVVNGRTYFRGTTGAYTRIATSLGADCNTASAAVFQSLGNLVADDDRDGYPPNNTQVTACVGATSTVSGRTYYVASAAPNDYFMVRTDCINRQGANCQAPFDCYDLSANARPGQTTFFAVDRGDGSFDYDCSGTTSSNTVVATYCSVTGGAQTFYTDNACTLGATAGTLCTTSTGFALPAGCGKFNVVTGIFYNPAVCTAAERLGPTQILCR